MSVLNTQTLIFITEKVNSLCGEIYLFFSISIFFLRNVAELNFSWIKVQTHKQSRSVLCFIISRCYSLCVSKTLDKWNQNGAHSSSYMESTLIQHKTTAHYSVTVELILWWRWYDFGSFPVFWSTGWLHLQTVLSPFLLIYWKIHNQMKGAVN